MAQTPQPRFDRLQRFLQIAIATAIVVFIFLAVRACWLAGLPLGDYPWESFGVLAICALMVSPLLDLGVFASAIVFQVAYLAVRYILDYAQGI